MNAPVPPAPVPPASTPAARSFALVLNDSAGGMGGAASPAEAIIGRLTSAGIGVRQMTEGKLSARIGAAARMAADAVVVMGGDGTVACACQQLAGGQTALGIIPAGTMNLLARDLRIPTDPSAAADILQAGHERQIDLGEIGEHIFACACMLGLPARIGRHREIARKRGNGPLAWLRVAHAAWRSAMRHKSMRLILRIDGRAVRVHTRSLTITVNRLDDASGRAFGRTVLEGGELCAYVLREAPLPGLLRLAWRVASGSSRDHALARLRGRVIEVEQQPGFSQSEGLRILIDGEEHVLAPPLRFVVRLGALRVIAPPPP